MTRIDKFNNDEFLPNMFVVDPRNCACTDCIMGYSTPEDELTVDQVIAAIVGGMELVERT